MAYTDHWLHGRALRLDVQLNTRCVTGTPVDVAIREGRALRVQSRELSGVGKSIKIGEAKRNAKNFLVRRISLGTADRTPGTQTIPN